MILTLLLQKDSHIFAFLSKNIKYLIKILITLTNDRYPHRKVLDTYKNVLFSHFLGTLEMNINTGSFHIKQKSHKNYVHKFLSSTSYLVLTIALSGFVSTFSEASDFYDRDFIEMEVPTFKSQAFVIKDSDDLVKHISLFAPQFQKAPGRGDIKLIPELQDDEKAQLRFEFVMRTVASQLNVAFFDFLPFTEDETQNATKSPSEDKQAEGQSDNTFSFQAASGSPENAESPNQTNTAQTHTVPESNPETKLHVDSFGHSTPNQFETTDQNTPALEKVIPDTEVNSKEVNHQDAQVNHHASVKNESKQLETHPIEARFAFDGLFRQSLNIVSRNNLAPNSVTHLFDQASQKPLQINRDMQLAALNKVSFVTSSDMLKALLDNGIHKSNQNVMERRAKAFSGNALKTTRENATIIKVPHHINHFSNLFSLTVSKNGLAPINTSKAEQYNGFSHQNGINKITFGLKGITNNHVISFMATLMSLPILTKLAGNVPSNNTPIRLPAVPQNISYSLRMLLRRHRFLSMLEV